MLAHMDEKWFYAIVVRQNNKYVPYLCVEPAPNTVHHKSHVAKVMCLCTTAFLPFKNDITSGGTAKRVDFERVGRMQKAKKDTYRRVYDDDGNYTMPKIPDNQLRVKGREYFTPMEVTGASEGTNKDPKFSLKKYFETQLLPRLEDTAQQFSAENNNSQVLVRFQWDGAGPLRSQTADGLPGFRVYFQKLDVCIATATITDNKHQRCLHFSGIVETSYGGSRNFEREFVVRCR